MNDKWLGNFIKWIVYITFTFAVITAVTGFVDDQSILGYYFAFVVGLGVACICLYATYSEEEKEKTPNNTQKKIHNIQCVYGSIDVVVDGSSRFITFYYDSGHSTRLNLRSKEQIQHFIDILNHDYLTLGKFVNDIELSRDNKKYISIVDRHQGRSGGVIVMNYKQELILKDILY